MPFSPCTHPCVRLGIALLVLVPASCKKPARPGVTYAVTVISTGKDGKATPQGEATRVESALVESEQAVAHEGHTFLLVVRKTQYGKATFDITFPDKTVQRTQVKAGEPKEVLPRGQKNGVRIEVLESH
jgi:hypothetical protein